MSEDPAFYNLDIQRVLYRCQCGDKHYLDAGYYDIGEWAEDRWYPGGAFVTVVEWPTRFVDKVKWLFGGPRVAHEVILDVDQAYELGQVLIQCAEEERRRKEAGMRRVRM